MLRRRAVIGWSILALVIVGPLALWGADREIQEPKTPIARLDVQPARVDWLPQVDYESLVLTVAGPEDLYIQRTFGAGERPSISFLDVRDGRLPDGIYAYELRTIPKSELLKREGSREESLVQSGYLWVQGGSFVNKIPIQPDSSRPGKPQTKPQLSNITAKTTVPDDLVVQGHACIGSACTAVVPGDPTLKLSEDFGGLFEIKFEPAFCCHPTANHWYIGANNISEPSGDFFIRNFNTVPFRIMPSAPANALTISSVTGNIGLGTSTPGAKLHMFANATDDTFGSAGPNPVSGPAFNFGYGGASFGRGAGYLNAKPDTSAVAPNPSLRFLTADVERMIITNTGKVGIGTSSPADKLHLFDSADVATSFRAENSSSGTNAQGSFRAQSNTAVVHFRAHGSGRTISRFGVVLGGWSEIVQDIGNGLAIGTQNTTPIILGTNNTNRVQIDGSTGAVTVAGNLTVNGTFSNPSSRELKEGFAPLDPSMMLKKFAQLPIQEWSYKSDEQKLRHVGPTVEDFRNAFGLGTEGQYIFPMDVQGVTMAAVQGLYQLVQEKGAQIAEMQKELGEIKRLLLEKADKQ